MQKQTSRDDSAVTAIRFVDDRDFLATSLSTRTRWRTQAGAYHSAVEGRRVQ
jgi:hypothetical protein